MIFRLAKMKMMMIGNTNRTLPAMMIEHTRGKVIVVTDSSKIGKVSNFFIEPISVVNTLITDNGISDKAKEDFIKLGIQVIIV